jgi:hypothetical protein
MTKRKIGIFVDGANGDIGLSTSVLKYKDMVWPDTDVVWFCNPSYLDMLKYNDRISEIRSWSQENFSLLSNGTGYLLEDQKSISNDFQDLDIGYFSAPWAVLPSTTFEGVHYADIPKIIFGVERSLEWHPYLKFSDEEREMTSTFCAALPHRKTIMLETQLRSAGDFRLGSEVLLSIMFICRRKFGKCNFIFASKVDHSALFDDPGVVSCSDFTVRQSALIFNHCDLFIGVSSGIGIAASCWGNNPVPRVEVCSSITATSVFANGTTNNVICDDLPIDEINKRLQFAIADITNKMA